MDINTALRAIESKYPTQVAHGQAESNGVNTSAEELAALSRGLSEAPTHEIEKIINQLQRLRTQLHNTGNRIERHIAHHTKLNQQTTQLTAIISDGVKKLPDGTKLPRHKAHDMVAAIREGVMEQLKRERNGHARSSS
jgi:predicted transcriptional regulator